MQGCLVFFMFFLSNLLFSQDLYNLLNNEIKTNLFDKSEQIEGKLILYATDFNNSVWVNPEKIENIDTLISLDEDINILLASISLSLFDSEKFNINSYLTALIPGSTEPYLPNSDDYNIPFKQELTAKNLMQQRSGMYDLFGSKFATSNNNMFLYSDSNFIFIIDSLASYISKNKLTTIDPNVSFNYNNLNYLILTKILNRITETSLISNLEEKISNLTSIKKFRIAEKISPYLLALFYRNIIKGEKIIPKRLLDNYLLSPISINNYYVEYAMGCFYYKKLGYGNINLYNNSVRLSLYIPEKDIFLLFYIIDTKIDKEDFLSSNDIDKLLGLLFKLQI